MFVNLSNHSSDKWDEPQLSAAKLYGDIEDISFPIIAAEDDEASISILADQYCNKICALYQPRRDVIHVMGEMCFSFALIKRLQKKGFVCLASTTERNVKEGELGLKEVCFQFVRFRKNEY